MGQHGGRLGLAVLPQRLAVLRVLVPRMPAASSAALTAPARPIASVPTAIPAGIWTIESSESIPFSACDSTGTPRTGRTV